MRVYYFILFTLIISCNPKVSAENIELLSGYWEIEAAVAPNGEERAYIGADEVDFFMLNQLKGFRKKLKPIAKDKFNNTLDKINFNVNFSEKKCFLTYNNQQHSWEEEIVSITHETLELKDKRGVIFRYRRYKK